MFALSIIERSRGDGRGAGLGFGPNLPAKGERLFEGAPLRLAGTGFLRACLDIDSYQSMMIRRRSIVLNGIACEPVDYNVHLGEAGVELNITILCWMANGR